MSVFIPMYKGPIKFSGSGTVSLSATTASDVITGLQAEKHAAWQFITTDQNLPDASSEINVWFQTSYDLGVTWIDLANLQFLDASGATNQNNNQTVKRVSVISLDQSPTTIRSLTTDGTGETGVTFTVNTKVDLPLGDRIRTHVVFANQTGSPSIDFKSFVNIK